MCIVSVYRRFETDDATRSPRHCLRRARRASRGGASAGWPVAVECPLRTAAAGRQLNIAFADTARPTLPEPRRALYCSIATGARQSVRWSAINSPCALTRPVSRGPASRPCRSRHGRAGCVLAPGTWPAGRRPLSGSRGYTQLSESSTHLGLRVNFRFRPCPPLSSDAGTGAGDEWRNHRAFLPMPSRPRKSFRTTYFTTA